MEGEENGYTGTQEGATAEGPGWDGDSGEEMEDKSMAGNETATFFYKEGEWEHVEKEDIGIAGWVKEHHGAGGHQVVRMPPF